jgi:hypothetical protein
MEERIGYIKRVSGHTFDTIYDLLFTTVRVIVVIIQHPLDVPFQIGTTETFFTGKRGKRNDRSERMKIAEDRLRHYEKKTLDELVTNQRFNFEIPYSKVQDVDLRKGLWRSSLRFRVSAPSGGLIKIRFTFTKKKYIEARDLLGRVLSSKIRN